MAETKEKQPGQLYMLFFTEMWERFSFYGMRSLLTLYMINELFKEMASPDANELAFGIYAAYGALVYATPYIGGQLADRFLGYQKSTIWGGILMMIGHFVMAIETQFFLYLALAFLIAGNGFFKPNISSMVGGLYEEGDKRRDGGFTIFYMGINLGAFLAPLICGYIGQTFGWFYGFGLAGLGMLSGLVVFLRGRKGLGENGGIPDPERLYKKGFLGLNREHWIYTLTIIGVAFVALFIHYYTIVEVLIPFLTFTGLLIVLVQAIKKGKVEMQRMFVILILTIVNIFFWAFFEQAGSSLTAVTQSNVDRNILGFVIPASVFQSVNPAFILILGPMFASMWVNLNRINKEPSTPLKFVFGMVLLGIGFLALSYGVNFVTVIGGLALVPLFFLILSYMLQTCGELSLSPVGLSMITKLSPKGMTAQLMGLWFLSTALSHTVAGQLAKLTSGGAEDPQVKEALESGVGRRRGKVEAYWMEAVTFWSNDWEQYKLVNKDYAFTSKERKAVKEAYNKKTADKLEQLIYDQKISKKQGILFSSGDRFQIREALQDSLKQGSIEPGELAYFKKHSREPMKRKIEHEQIKRNTYELMADVVERIQRSQKDSLKGIDCDFCYVIDNVPIRRATIDSLDKWSQAVTTESSPKDTLLGCLKRNALSKEQLKAIFLGTSNEVEKILNDSLQGGRLSKNEIDFLVEKGQIAGKEALKAGTIEKSTFQKFRGKNTEEPAKPQVLSSYDQLSNYSSVYTMIGSVSVSTGVVLIFLIPVLRKWMHGVH
ncbi:MAG: peptide MFS transporter [Flavobacteriales bacterium]